MTSTTLRIIAVLLALGAIIIGYVGYQTSQQPQPSTQVAQPKVVEPKTYPVLVAARPLAAGHTVSASDLTTLELAQHFKDAYTDKQELIGRQLRIDMVKDEIFLPQQLNLHGPMVNNIRTGERAVAITVDEVTGVGGFITPGDNVDVIFFLPASRQAGPENIARTILTNVRVLAYGNDLETIDKKAIRERSRSQLSDKAGAEVNDSGQEAPDAEKPTGKKSKTAILAVKADSLPMLFLAESSGRLRLALRGEESSGKPAVAQLNEKDIMRLGQLSDNSSKAAAPGAVTQLVTAKPAQPVAKPKPQQPANKVYIYKGSNVEAITVK